MKNKILAILFAVLTLSAFAETPAVSASSYTITPSVASQYFFRGSKLAGVSLQPSVETNEGNITVGFWSNVPLTNKISGLEIDAYASYNIALSDSLAIVPGFTLYTYPHAAEDRLTFEPNLGLTYTWGNLTLTPKAYYDTVLRGTTLEFNSSLSIPFALIHSEIILSASAGRYVIKYPEYVRQNYWLAGFSIPFDITKNSKLTTGVFYTRGIDSGGYVTLGYSITF